MRQRPGLQGAEGYRPSVQAADFLRKALMNTAKITDEEREILEAIRKYYVDGLQDENIRTVFIILDRLIRSSVSNKQTDA